MHRSLEVRGDTEPGDGNELKTLIVITINDREIQLDVESNMENSWPTSVSSNRMQGRILLVTARVVTLL